MFCATEWGASGLLGPLEAAYPAFSDEELPQAEAIVVLGGGINGESRFGLGGDFNQAADRLWRGATLYRAQKAPWVVLSGGTTLSGGLPESVMMAQKWGSLGLPAAPLIQEPDSRTTRENAQYTRALLQGRGIEHILLVTSASHMRRAAAAFTSQGFIVTAVATDHQTPSIIGPVPALVTHGRAPLPALPVPSMSGSAIGFTRGSVTSLPPRASVRHSLQGSKVFGPPEYPCAETIKGQYS